MSHLAAFILAFLLSLGLTPVVRRLAFRVGAVDQPGDARKIHSKPTARLGGLAIFLAFVLVLPWFLPMSRSLAGLLGGVIVLLIVGTLDDIYGMSPWHKLGFQILAACVALSGGIGISLLTNPLGGFIHLDYGRFAVDLGALHFHITPIANLLSIIWIVGLVNAINFLDGLDGLACGVSGIAALVMYMLTIQPNVHQPASAIIAIILAGAALGFLPYNFAPARIFMGDSGAYFLGLTLALLAIYSGAKLATASLVLGFPIVDGMWTVLRRLYHRTSPFKADRRHLHHLFLDAGMSQPQAVLTLYFLSLTFGVVALVSGSFVKLVALFVLLAVVAALIMLLLRLARRRSMPSV